MINQAYSLLKTLKKASAMGGSSSSFMPLQPLPNSVKAKQLEEEEMLAEMQNGGSDANSQLNQMQKAQQDAVTKLQESQAQIQQLEGQLQNAQMTAQQSAAAMQAKADQQVEALKMKAEAQIQEEKIKSQRAILSMQEKHTNALNKSPKDQSGILSNQLRRVTDRIAKLQKYAREAVDVEFELVSSKSATVAGHDGVSNDVKKPGGHLIEGVPAQQWFQNNANKTGIPNSYGSVKPQQPGAAPTAPVAPTSAPPTPVNAAPPPAPVASPTPVPAPAPAAIAPPPAPTPAPTEGSTAVTATAPVSASAAGSTSVTAAAPVSASAEGSAAAPQGPSFIQDPVAYTDKNLNREGIRDSLISEGNKDQSLAEQGLRGLGRMALAPLDWGKNFLADTGAAAAGAISHGVQGTADLVSSGIDAGKGMGNYLLDGANYLMASGDRGRAMAGQRMDENWNKNMGAASNGLASAWGHTTKGLGNMGTAGLNVGSMMIPGLGVAGGMAGRAAGNAIIGGGVNSMFAQNPTMAPPPPASGQLTNQAPQQEQLPASPNMYDAQYGGQQPMWKTGTVMGPTAPVAKPRFGAMNILQTTGGMSPQRWAHPALGTENQQGYGQMGNFVRDLLFGSMGFKLGQPDIPRFQNSLAAAQPSYKTTA